MKATQLGICKQTVTLKGLHSPKQNLGILKQFNAWVTFIAMAIMISGLRGTLFPNNAPPPPLPLVPQTSPTTRLLGSRTKGSLGLTADNFLSLGSPVGSVETPLSVHWRRKSDTYPDLLQVPIRSWAASSLTLRLQKQIYWGRFSG